MVEVEVARKARLPTSRESVITVASMDTSLLIVGSRKIRMMMFALVDKVAGLEY